MSLSLYSVIETDRSNWIARALSLPEAFARVMALSGREQWFFTRTGRVMHLVILPGQPEDPEFTSPLAVDRAARNDVMALVCAWGFGSLRAIPEEQQPAEPDHESAA